MLEECKSAQERWGGVSTLIDRWLKERQQLLVKYSALASPRDDEEPHEREDTLRQFCQILVDYVSAGHFEVYEKLVAEGREFGDEAALKKAKGYYKTIDESTETILDFNDKYQETDDLDALNRDLSGLGEALASRFEAEDNMIEILHMAHKEQFANSD